MRQSIDYLIIIAPAICAVLLLLFPVRDQSDRITALGWIAVMVSLLAIAHAVYAKIVADRDERARETESRERASDILMTITGNVTASCVAELGYIAIAYIPHDEAERVYRALGTSARHLHVPTDSDETSLSIAPLIALLVKPGLLDERREINGSRMCDHTWRWHLSRDFMSAHLRLQEVAIVNRGLIPYKIETRLNKVSTVAKNLAEIFDRKKESSDGREYIQNYLGYFVSEAANLRREVLSESIGR